MIDNGSGYRIGRREMLRLADPDSLFSSARPSSVFRKQRSCFETSPYVRLPFHVLWQPRLFLGGRRVCSLNDMIASFHAPPRSRPLLA